MKKPKFSFTEWELIIWAYSYEVESYSLVSDACFDLTAETLGTSKNIPDFDPATGMWVHDVVKIVGHDFLRGATKKLREIGKGAAVSHIKFPKGWLSPLPRWKFPTAFDHIPQDGIDSIKPKRKKKCTSGTSSRSSSSSAKSRRSASSQRGRGGSSSRRR